MRKILLLVDCLKDLAADKIKSSSGSVLIQPGTVNLVVRIWPLLALAPRFLPVILQITATISTANRTFAEVWLSNQKPVLGALRNHYF